MVTGSGIHVLALGCYYTLSLTIVITYTLLLSMPTTLTGNSAIGCQLTLSEDTANGTCNVTHTIRNESHQSPIKSYRQNRCYYKTDDVYLYPKEDGNSERHTICSSRDLLKVYYAWVVACSVLVLFSVAITNGFCLSRLRYTQKKVTDYSNLAGYLLLDTNQLHEKDDVCGHITERDNYLSNGLKRDDYEIRRRFDMLSDESNNYFSEYPDG